MHMMCVQTANHEETCGFSAHLPLPVPEESQVTSTASLCFLVSRRQKKSFIQQVITEPVPMEPVSHSDIV